LKVGTISDQSLITERSTLIGSFLVCFPPRLGSNAVCLKHAAFEVNEVSTI